MCSECEGATKGQTQDECSSRATSRVGITESRPHESLFTVTVKFATRVDTTTSVTFSASNGPVVDTRNLAANVSIWQGAIFEVRGCSIRSIGIRVTTMRWRGDGALSQGNLSKVKLLGVKLSMKIRLFT